MNAEVDTPDTMVRHFRQILLWPLQLMPIQENAQIQKHWEVLENSGPENPWRELSSEFSGDQSTFQPVSYTHLDVYKRQRVDRHDQHRPLPRCGQGARR